MTRYHAVLLDERKHTAWDGTLYRERTFVAGLPPREAFTEIAIWQKASGGSEGWMTYAAETHKGWKLRLYLFRHWLREHLDIDHWRAYVRTLRL